MTRRSAGALAAIWLALGTWPVGATGTHNTVGAALVMRPQLPSMGRPWAISIVLRSTDGLPHPNRRVRLVAEMTGHAMRPESVELSRSDEPDVYSGTLVLTMRGPWKITVRMEDVNDLMLGSFNVQAGGDADGNGAPEMRDLVQLARPVRPNLVPPGWVVAAAFGLTVAFQAGARLLQHRCRTRPSGRADARRA